MELNLEVVVPEESRRAVSRELSDLPRTHVVTEPTTQRRALRFCMATTAAFERPESDVASWIDAVYRHVRGLMPLVIRWEPESAASWVSVQSVASVSAHLHRTPTLVVHDKQMAHRFFRAQLDGAGDRLIASAALRGKTLEVWSCEPKLYRVPIERVPVLRKLSPEGLASFTVSASGSRIHWPEGDVDLNLEGVRAVVDPKIRNEQRERFRAEAKHYGSAIRALREEHSLRQDQIPGVEERTVRRIEKGETLPRSGTLERLALAHSMSVRDYMNELARRAAS